MADTLGLINENESAVREFLTANAGKAHSYLRKIGKSDPHERESIIHDALIALMRKLQLNYVFDVPEAYFFGIIKKMGLKHNRKKLPLEGYNDEISDFYEIDYITEVEKALQSIDHKCRELLKISIYEQDSKSGVLDKIMKKLDLLRNSAKATKSKCEEKVRQIVLKHLDIL